MNNSSLLEHTDIENEIPPIPVPPVRTTEGDRYGLENSYISMGSNGNRNEKKRVFDNRRISSSSSSSNGLCRLF